MLENTERAGSVLSPDPEGDAAEARTLKLLLGINGAMFVFEMVVGVMAQSTGLIADSLDMFADAAVYGLALYAVGRAAALKLKAAHIAGWLQAALALGALAEVIRRAVFGSEPQFMLMMGMGLPPAHWSPGRARPPGSGDRHTHRSRRAQRRTANPEAWLRPAGRGPVKCRADVGAKQKTPPRQGLEPT
ncbi:hypothetical protein [Thiobacillus sp.]|uniref:hypothetical protein n=1 Tax=Thiobacillus sp. TaxID=924 RepID=UPI0025EB3630|nr:hypothetical protein [Thiobacillus sp.]